MSGTIKGIIVEIGGDTSKLQKAFSKVNSITSSLSKELRGVNSLLKLDPKNVELLEQKQTILNESIDATQDKLNQLKKIKEEADKKMAEGTKISEENYRNLQREIINTQNKLNGLTDELKQFNAQNSNWTKAGKKVQEYGKTIEEASSKVDELGNKVSVASAGVIAGGTVLANSAMNLEDAVAKYISSTNTATNETEKYRKVLENIHNNNYGEDYNDIANSMSAVTKQLKNLDSSELENITEKAIAFRDLWGEEVSESIRAVKALMDNFNISADEAFNLLAEGKKQGLDFSNELLDNVNEYSVQFKKLGLNAQDMFNIFKVGADNGAFNLDKIGDAVKEFSIRAIDGSNTTIDGFKRIGLNADEMAKKFANGGEEAKQAFIEVISRLGSMDDKVSQSIAGVDLFGTMWEDLGPTVVTSFNKMDNGISQSNDSMQKSIDELYDTTKKKIEAELRRLKGIGADFGEEMLPVLEDLIDMAEGFIDKLEGMSDAEKENILKIALLVAGTGPLIKTIRTLGKGLGTVTKGFGIFSEAVGVATNKTTSNTKAVNNAAKALNAITSPAGIAVTALGLYAAGVSAVTAKVKEEIQSIKDLNVEIQGSTEARNSALETINSQRDVNLAEINNVKTLKNELSTLVDENGKVKAGYETRVNFILTELNKALGTEYEMNQNIVKSYKEMQGSIDELILKKKAQIILEANEEKYQEAIRNKTQNYEEQLKIQQKINEIMPEYNRLLEDAKKGWIGSSEGMIQGTTKLKEYDEQLRELGGTLQDLDKQSQEYGDAIVKYDQNVELMLEGGVENYKKIEQSVATTQTNITNNTNEELEKRIQNQIAANQKAKEIYDLEAKYNKDSKNSIYAENVKQGQKQLEMLAQQLAATTSLTEEMTPKQMEAWRNLANNSYGIYSQTVSNMPIEMQQKIQETTGVIAAGTPEMQAVAGKLGQETIEKFDKSAEARQKAIKILQEYLNGLEDKEKRELLQQAGIQNAEAIIKELDRGDLSEESGKSILEGLWKGLKNSTLQKDIMSTVGGIVKSIASSFSINIPLPKISGKQQLPGHKTGLDYVPYDNYVARLHKGERVLTAKENKNLMSLEKLGKIKNTNLNNLAKNITNKNNFFFNIQINPKSLTEADMKKCFDFFNKEAGKYL